MAIGVVDSSMTRMPNPSEQTRPGLRRATYVHVSDLTSAYNIDHALLERELSRVKAEREAATAPEKVPVLGETEEDPSSAASDVDPAIAPVPQKRLQPPRGGFNLCVLVGKVNVVVDKRRVDQSRVRLAEVEIGDETGTVSLRARDEQIDVLNEVSHRRGAVVLRNCTLELYQGKHIRLAVTKWGKLSVYPDSVASTPPSPSKMNYDRNFSLIDLSVVASEMVDTHPVLGYGIKGSKSPDPSGATGRSTGSKSGGQTHSKHQQSQSSQKRSSRDRRQRGRSGSTGTIPQTYMQPQAGQMRYHGMHAFSPYEQGMDLAQYSYTHRRQQEAVLSPSTAQQMLLQQHQQFNVQHHQLQPLYRGTQERPHAAQAAGMMLSPGVASGSFDLTGEYQVPYPASSNSLLVPVQIRGQQSPAAATSQEQYAASHGSPPSGSTEGSERNPQTRQGMLKSVSTGEVPYDDSQFSPGTMNPQAMAFAPAYIPIPAHHQTTQQIYYPFNPSQPGGGGVYRPAPSHHQAVYAQGIPSAQTPEAQASEDIPSSHEADSHSSQTGVVNESDSVSNGKENVKSP